MIYYVGRHRGIVTVNGVEVPAVHCDDMLGYAVVLKRAANGLGFMLNRNRTRAQREVMRGQVVFTPFKKDC